MATSVLSPGQFSGRREIRRDPNSDSRKAKFSGAAGSKTMQLARGRGLRPAPNRHRHREHAGARSHRADAPKKA